MQEPKDMRKKDIKPENYRSRHGDPLGCIRFTAPLQQLFNKIAYTFPDILICIFADNMFLGPQSQVLMAADLFNTLLAAANLALNPIDSSSNILLTYPGLPRTLPITTTITTNNGLEFRCTAGELSFSDLS
jgi:hypothetical protein